MARGKPDFVRYLGSAPTLPVGPDGKTVPFIGMPPPPPPPGAPPGPPPGNGPPQGPPQ